jgi:hypothetical protein
MKTLNKVTLGSLCNSSNIPESLIRAVVRQMGGWESFTQSAPDICRGGIDGGFHGFIYYTETEPFSKRNRREISEMAEAQANDFGMEVSAMIRGFGCFKGCDVTGSEVGRALYAGENMPDGNNVLNALAWYAGEEVSRAYCDLTGEND